jgi:hypothetical protein
MYGFKNISSTVDFLNEISTFSRIGFIRNFHCRFTIHLSNTFLEEKISIKHQIPRKMIHHLKDPLLKLVDDLKEF